MNRKQRRALSKRDRSEYERLRSQHEERQRVISELAKREQRVQALEQRASPRDDE